MGSKTKSPGTLGPPLSRGHDQEKRESPGLLVTPVHLFLLPTDLQTHLRFIFLCCLLCRVQASPANSRAARASHGPETSVPAKPGAAPRLMSPQLPRSQAGPELWPGRTSFFMEPQGLSPLLSAGVYRLVRVCLMIFLLGDAPVWKGPACHPSETPHASSYRLTAVAVRGRAGRPRRSW